MVGHVVVMVVAVAGLAWCAWACCVIVREELRARRVQESIQRRLNQDHFHERVWEGIWDECDTLDPEVKARLNRVLDDRD
jgi:hypothetical protein